MCHIHIFHSISQNIIVIECITGISVALFVNKHFLGRRPGDKPLSEPLMIILPTHICVTRPQWVKRWSGLDLFNDDTCPSGHTSRPTQVNVSQSCFNPLNKLHKLNYVVHVWGLVDVNCVISDRVIPLLAGIALCKSRELSRRGYSMSQLCSIHHDIPVTLHTPGAYGQWPVFDHNGDKQSTVLGTRYGTWWPLYGRF